VLVRPDVHVAWRSPGLSADPVRELRAALVTLLDRHDGAPGAHDSRR
jgi:2,4-dichlorophenol 6-monooxygenase